MGDVGEDYRAWENGKRERKQEQKKLNMEIIADCNLPYSIDSSGTVLFKTPGGTVCFYPTTNTVMHKKNVMRGGARKVIAYVKNINALSEKSEAL